MLKKLRFILAAYKLPAPRKAQETYKLQNIAVRCTESAIRAVAAERFI